MGCGKSSIGRELAALLYCPAVDLDGVIEQRTGRKIHEIFESAGEAGFRQLELKALREVLGAGKETDESSDGGSENLILSLGGGTLTTPECAALVHEKTTCIYLRATIDTLVENLEEDGVANRPMLGGGTPLRERIMELMGSRNTIYEETAHNIIDIDGETPRETAIRIAEFISPKGFHQNPEQAKPLRDPAQKTEK